ncbi:hypothetical protein EJB05_39918, partial [Eragrostis curvula]
LCPCPHLIFASIGCCHRNTVTWQQFSVGELQKSHHSLSLKKEKVVRLERSLQDLSEQLSFAHAECIEKEAILAKQAKVAEEAILGWEKAEAEAITLKTQLDDTVDQKAAIEQRICQLDEALNVAMVERESLIKDTNQLISCEQNKVLKLDENLSEKMNIIASLDAENDKLSEILSVKEKIISELIESNRVTVLNFKDLAVKLESAERSNSSLRYEVCMLQKQLEIRSEERKFSLKSADAAHRQHLENVKKITKLESECQRLRSMVRKRLPGPAAIAKMRSEVETSGSNPTSSRTRKLNSTASFDSCIQLQKSHDTSHGNSPLLARLHAIEDENKAIKEALAKKDGEVQFSRTMLARTTSKLSQVEAQLEELSRDQTAAGLVKGSPTVVENPLSSISEVGCSKDNVSCSGSWTSALLSELEHFKKGKLTAHSSKSTRVSDMSFMDDFAEIEKLASICDNNKHMEPYDSKIEVLESPGKELVPVDCPTRTTNQIHQCKIEKAVLKLIELIEGVIQRSSKECCSNVALSGADEDNSQKPLSGYVARAFLWNTSELTSVLQNFVFVCNELLYGNTDIESFVHDLHHTLDWIISHCFSLRDVSDMKETIMKDLELSNSDEVEVVAGTKHIGIHTTDGINEAMATDNVQMLSISESRFTYTEPKVDDGTQNISNKIQDSNDQVIEKTALHMRLELNELKESGKAVANTAASASESCTHESTLHLESCSANEGLKNVAENEEKHLQMQLEISTASEKLIECRETILNLGKQLKALAAPKDAVLFDKVLDTAVKSEQKPRSRSLSEILSMDDPSSPKTKEIICTEPRAPRGRNRSADERDDGSAASSSRPVPMMPHMKPRSASRTCRGEADARVAALALVPSKQKGNSSLFKRILTGKRKDAMVKPKVVLSS